MVSIMALEQQAVFDGCQARRHGEPREVPSEYTEVTDWWLRGWDRVAYLIEQDLETENEREAQEDTA